MMNRYSRWALLAAMTALSVKGISAVNAVAALANPMDNAGISARAIGMGGTFVGVAEGSASLFWNPAGLDSSMHTMELALHHNAWLGGISQETAVLGLPLGRFGGLAISGNYVSYGTFAGYDSSGNRTGDYSADRYGVALGWGKELGANVAVGLAVKGSLQTLDGQHFSEDSADLGLLWTPVAHWRLGMDYTNLGGTISGHPLASDFRLGTSYAIQSKDNQLLLAASTTLESQGVNRIQVGAEDLIHDALALRLGYQFNLAETQIEGLTGLTAGLGVAFDHLSLDYAFLPFGDLGSTHRLSLTYQFGK